MIKPKRSVWPKILALMLLVPLGFCAVLLYNAIPRYDKIIGAYVRAIASGEIDEAVLNYMEKNSITYGRLVDMHFDNNGSLTSVTADTAKIDALIARLDDEIGVDLEEKVVEVTVPLNVLLGTEMIAGAGPDIRVSFFPLNLVNVQVRHEFVSQGINQTLHTIFLDISVEVEILLPFHSRRESVNTELMIGQTLIVGGVPNAYVEK
ncbi:MAG: sporulation protein YunB [Oscillospiraceae bacterium]|nr:sporulation protein YunB [Oscillospiraceae bacterium]